jgi:hypothetical protein
MDCRRFSFLLPSCCVITLALGASYTNAQASTVTVTPVKDVAIASARPASVAKPKLPAEMPATPPQVTCVGDQLTIVANNSTMASVFASLHKCIGVAIDLPSGFSTSRVFAELGPGPVNQVLQSLLSSTDLDYVIQLSSTDSTKVQAVILTARVDEVKDSLSSPELTSTPARRAWLETRHNARRTQEESESSALTESQAGYSRNRGGCQSGCGSKLRAGPARLGATVRCSDWGA